MVREVGNGGESLHFGGREATFGREIHFLRIKDRGPKIEDQRPGRPGGKPAMRRRRARQVRLALDRYRMQRFAKEW